MSLDLIDVELYPIEKFDTTTPEGKAKLQTIIARGPDLPHFLVATTQEKLDKRIVTLYYFPVQYQNPPFPPSKVRIIKYQIVHIFKDENSGKVMVYGFPISSS